MISRRRAILAIASWPLVPPCVVVLAKNDRWAGALVLGLLFLVYVAIEVCLYERRDHAAAAAHLRYERAAAGPILGTYCAQVEDHYYERVEHHNRWSS